MSWTDLPTNYQDAVWTGLRKYQMLTNSDGTVSFQDVTQYQQIENSFFNAANANSMNEAINEIMNSLSGNGVTYYVNGSTGSDSNDGKSSTNAFKTIQKAVDTINTGEIGTITVTAGTYAETVTINNKQVTINPLGAIVLNGLVVTRSRFTMQSQTLTVNGAVSFGGDTYAYVLNLVVNNSVERALSVLTGSKVFIYTLSVTTSHTSGKCIVAQSVALFGTYTLTCSGKTGIEVSTGAVVSYNTYTSSNTTTPISESSGGRVIYSDRYYTQDQINNALALKADLASPVFSGTPTAPTPEKSDDSLKLATTAFVKKVLSFVDENTAAFHNSIPRCKNITSYFTDGSLWDRIKGTNGYALFEDLYLGDYITVDSRTYMIVDFDYYIRCGDTDITEHHIVMMPTENMNIPAGTVLYGSSDTLTLINTANAGVTVSSQETATSKKWNATMENPNTNTTAGGYKYSRMRQVIMKAADTLVVNAFGSAHVKAFNVIYPNPASASESGLASGWTWFNNADWSNDLRKSMCDLPNETQIYGQQVWGRGSAYTNVGYEVGTDKFQFSLFRVDRSKVNIRASGWLRSVGSATYAAIVSPNGNANTNGSAFALGVRPRFLLVG